VHVVTNITDDDVFIDDSVLGQVLRISLVNTVVFSVHKLTQFLTMIKNNDDTFHCIRSEEDCLLMDTLIQMYSKLNNIELSELEIISPDWRVFYKTFPLKSTHLHQENEAKLLEPTTAFPPDSNRKINTLIKVVGLPVSYNKWDIFPL
jgi:hypothetical protein